MAWCVDIAACEVECGSFAMLSTCRQTLALSAAGEDHLLNLSHVSFNHTQVWQPVRCRTHAALLLGEKLARLTRLALLPALCCAAACATPRTEGCVAVDPHASISCTRAVVATRHVPELRAHAQLFPGGITCSAAPLQVPSMRLLATKRILPRNTGNGTGRCGSYALTLSH